MTITWIRYKRKRFIRCSGEWIWIYALTFILNFVLCHSDDNSSKHPLPSEVLGICHPVLDTGTRMKAPSFGNVAAYVWIPCQARDDNYREPHLNEDAVVIKRTLFKEDETRTSKKLRILSKRQPFTTWKVIFYIIKGDLLCGKRRPFITY